MVVHVLFIIQMQKRWIRILTSTLAYLKYLNPFKHSKKKKTKNKDGNFYKIITRGIRQSVNHHITSCDRCNLRLGRQNSYHHIPRESSANPKFKKRINISFEICNLSESKNQICSDLLFFSSRSRVRARSGGELCFARVLCSAEEMICSAVYIEIS